MKEIKEFNDLPYSIEILNKIAKVRFGETFDNVNLSEAILMANLIKGVTNLDDHYILMDDSENIFEIAIEYNIFTPLSLIDFKERKKNRRRRHDLGLIDTQLWSMETYFEPTHIYNMRLRIKL